MLKEIIDEHIKRKIRVTPCHTNRASEIGHPCLRYLVYNRLNWDKAALPSLRKQYLYEEGKHHERTVVQVLLEAGIDVLQRARDFYLDKFKLSGHIDGKIELRGKIFAIEIKSTNPGIFDSIFDSRAILEHSNLHVRMWPYQLQTYMALDKKKEGVLILKDRLSGQINDIVISYDENLVDEIFSKCRKVNWYVSRHQLPAFDKKLDSGWCNDCKYVHICLPDREAGETIPVNNDEALIALIEEHQRLKEYHRAYLELDQVLNRKLESVERQIIGNYLVTGKWIERKEYTVPPTRYWQKKIVRL